MKTLLQQLLLDNHLREALVQIAKTSRDGKALFNQMVSAETKLELSLIDITEYRSLREQLIKSALELVEHMAEEADEPVVAQEAESSPPLSEDLSEEDEGRSLS